MDTVLILHPGEMGAAIGRTLRARGTRVLWVSSDRGDATRARADSASLDAIAGLADALDAAQVVLSVCPPHAAVQVAESVAAQRYRGVYVDANAISPETTRRIARCVEAAGAEFVDGGIVGPPPAPKSSTRLYLSGRHADRVAALFADTDLAAILLAAPIGAASALKACYAAWTKGTAALLLAIHAVAQHEQVAAALAEEWRISQPDLFQRTDRAVNNVRKGWRWIGEMEEIAATFAGAELPGGFHSAAAEVFRRLEPFKGDRSATLQDVLAALNRS